ncbi:MAG: hypothetical protein IJ736_04180 [Firmicutes bacterium]|nr:hypothetical protein [Bacillota bacterium]
MRDYFKFRFDENYRKFGFKGKNIEDHKKWKEEIRERISKTIGLDKMIKCEKDVKKTESKEFDEYIREKYIMKTQPYIEVPFYVLFPKKNKNDRAVITLHGHGSDGKSLLVGEKTEELEKSERFNYGYALEMVKRGYTVFVPDMCASGERREENVDITKSSCNDVNNAAVSLGFSLRGLIMWDILRLLDYIDEDYDFKGIDCVGFSGGGLSSLWLSALDDRIENTIVSGYYHGIRDTILYNNLCGCNFVPNLWEMIDICDLGIMIAPRKLAVEVGKDDNLNGERGIVSFYEQVKETKKVYEMYNRGDNFKEFVGEGKHQWYGLAYDYIKETPIN